MLECEGTQALPKSVDEIKNRAALQTVVFYAVDQADLKAQTALSFIVKANLQTVKRFRMRDNAKLKSVDFLRFGIETAQLDAVGRSRLRGKCAELKTMQRAEVKIAEVITAEREFFSSITRSEQADLQTAQSMFETATT